MHFFLTHPCTRSTYQTRAIYHEITWSKVCWKVLKKRVSFSLIHTPDPHLKQVPQIIEYMNINRLYLIILIQDQSYFRSILILQVKFHEILIVIKHIIESQTVEPNPLHHVRIHIDMNENHCSLRTLLPQRLISNSKCSTQMFFKLIPHYTSNLKVGPTKKIHHL